MYGMGPPPFNLIGLMTKSRADALQNRVKLLDAADAVFLELGIDAPLDVIAERAGVGRATLFRNFADRSALLQGLSVRSNDDLEREATRIEGDSGALARTLRFLTEFIVLRAPIVEYWHSSKGTTDESVASKQRLLDVFEKIVAWAVAAGVCRPDLTPNDLLLLVQMLNGVVHVRSPEDRQVQAERALQLIVRAIDLRDEGLCCAAGWEHTIGARAIAAHGLS